ncbi:hypothetical protein F5Y11DRAFT_367235 [Daldinia sp. FL1419]|nr:hypothetical protein F5Y11DRAFT_367235 [Daldinia sp. FL1419]
MNHLRQQARALFLHRVKPRNDRCQVFEIWGTDNRVIHSERVVLTHEVPLYLKYYSGVPVLKFIQFPVRISHKSRQQPYQQLAWIPEILTGLGIEPYMIGLLTRGPNLFEAVERESRELGKVLSIFMNGVDSRILASYNFTTKSTICLLFTLEKSSDTRYEDMAKFLRRSSGLFQSSYFVPLLILVSHTDLVLDGFGSFFGYDLQHVKETNLQDWEISRNKLRWVKHYNHLARNISRYLRKKLDEDVALGIPASSSHGSVVQAQIREALRLLELTINPAARDVEWHLQRNEDHMGQISRKMMRQDTMASISLSETSVELSKMATFDSSSMKVIAAMTMVFLPGMFFASLFSMPLLDWDEQKVVRKKFWVYWAFTGPSTVLIVILWLGITQFKQMRGFFHVGRR